MKANKKYKDRIFCKLFGQNKENALSLYNAVNGSSYTNIDDLKINTIDDAIYMGMKNDVSFIFDDYINMYEHQSTYNPNMPLRGLLYLSKVYEKEYAEDKAIYAPRAIEIATPKFVVFYNGDEYHEPIEMLSLTDLMSHPKDSDIELNVKIININYSENNNILNACEMLKHYSIFVQKVKDNLVFNENLLESIDSAVDECISKGVLSTFLKENRNEVIDVMLEEYNEKKELKKVGDFMYAEGIAEGKHYEKLASIRRMLTKLSEEDVLSLGYSKEEIEEAKKMSSEK